MSVKVVNKILLQRVVFQLSKATPDNQAEMIQAAATQLGLCGYISAEDAALSIMMTLAGAYESAARVLVPTDPVPGYRLGQWWWRIESWPHEHSAHVAYENGDSGIFEAGAKAATPGLALAIAAVNIWLEIMHGV